MGSVPSTGEAEAVAVERRWVGLLMAVAIVVSVTMSRPHTDLPSVEPPDAFRVYASYHLEDAPDVLNFVQQPHWVPTCLLWEVMRRDPWLQADLHRAGCRLRPYGFYKGVDATEYLRQGRLHGGMIGDLPLLNMASQFDLRIVALCQQGPTALLARRALPLEQLRGRRIGYAPGTVVHYYLIQALHDHGVPEEDVVLVPTDIRNMADDLAAGRLDAFFAWEPTVSRALLAHPSFEVIYRKDSRGYLFFTGVFARRHPDAARAVTASLVRAVRWLRVNDRNLYIASGWARQGWLDFMKTPATVSVHDILRTARGDLLRSETAPRLLAPWLRRGGAVYEQFHLSRDIGLVPRRAAWDPVRRSFDLDLVPQLEAASGAWHLDDLHLSGER